MPLKWAGEKHRVIVRCRREMVFPGRWCEPSSFEEMVTGPSCAQVPFRDVRTDTTVAALAAYP
jgi:hypothetical protein